MTAKRCNLLLSVSGYKSYLIGILARSARAGELVATDADPRATIAHVAPHFVVVPQVRQTDAYLANLRAIVEQYAIDAIVPQNDMDLQLLADNEARLAARVLGAPPQVVRQVGDKLAMGDFLATRGIASPSTWRVGDQPRPTFPVMVKARSGQGSAGLIRCDGPADYSQAHVDDIAQPLLQGEEYNLDILRAPNGEVISVVPKLKLAMRYGSTDKARSVDAPDLIELGIKLGDAVGHIGGIDVDLMMTREGPMVLDINPRLGGGFPFTAQYCPAYVDALLAVALGESPPSLIGQYARDVTVYRDTHFFSFGQPR